jgi:methyl-accepting chemotaxis protein
MDATIKAMPRQSFVQMDKLERELRQVVNGGPPAHVEDLGRMSAEAVLAQYETAAREFEIMGDEIKARIEKLQASLDDAHEALRLLADAAKAIRDKGQLAHAQIEEMSAVTKHVRDAVAEATKKITG